MSRTKHHSQKHGSVPMGEGYHRRGCGYEYWGRDAGPGADSYTIRRNVRRRGAREIQSQFHEALEDREDNSYHDCEEMTPEDWERPWLDAGTGEWEEEE